MSIEPFLATRSELQKGPPVAPAGLGTELRPGAIARPATSCPAGRRGQWTVIVPFIDEWIAQW